MSLKLLHELVGEFALAHPEREISDVGMVEFLEWVATRRT